LETAITATASERWIRRGEALARLGVKTQTLYAYVSRGRITARPDPRLYAEPMMYFATVDLPAPVGMHAITR
jgi:hypothetical protein